jgi:hypothetical protein
MTISRIRHSLCPWTIDRKTYSLRPVRNLHAGERQTSIIAQLFSRGGTPRHRPSRTERVSRLSAGLVIVLFLMVGTQRLWAQQTMTGITGRVTDPNGSAIARSTVTATNLDTGAVVNTKTSETGVYVISNAALQLGTYSLTVSAPGFKTWQDSDIRLVTGQVLTYDVTLVVGATTEEVQVHATADALDTTTSTMGTTTTADEIKDLPMQLAGTPRSSLAFLATMSAISTAGTGSLSRDKGSYGGAAIMGTGGNGSNNGFAGYTIDGMSAATRYFTQLGDQYTIVPDAIQELRLASNFNAESAWNSGVEVSLITKSGTNQFHGSVYEYFGNTVLDAKNYFASQASSERQNEFGFTLGGPIRRNKTFFFGSLDFYRFTNSAGGLVQTVPTAAMRNGDFSQLLGAQIGTDALGRPVYMGEIYDPATTRTLSNGMIVRDPFNCNGVLNTICSNRFSSVSGFLQAGYPDPTLPGTQNNWVGTAAPAPLTADKFTFRIDHQFDKEKQSLMFGMDAAPVYNPGITGIPQFKPLLTPTINDPYYFYRGRIGYSFTINPNLLYSLYVTGSYIGSTLDNGNSPSSTAGQAAGLKGVSSPQLPVVSISQTSGFGFGWLYDNPQFSFPIVGTTLTWVKGKHTFKFGGDYLRNVIALNPFTFWSAGSFNFSQLETGLPGYTGSGYGYASFLLGEVDSAALNNIVKFKSSDAGFGAFAQDQWRITSRLTINYGLRWGGIQYPWEAHDLFGAFSPTVPNPGAGGLPGAIQFWGTGKPDAIGLHYSVDPNYKLFDPRLGVAYQVTKNSVVRAYYGITHIPNFSAFNTGTNVPGYGTGDGNFAGAATPASTNNGVTAAFNWDQGFKGSVAPDFNPAVENGFSVDELLPHVNKVGMTQSFGLSFEQGLPWGFTGKLEYLGNNTRGIFWNTSFPYPSINQISLKDLALGPLLEADINSSQAVEAGIKPPYLGFTGSVAQALRPYPQYLDITPLNNPSSFSEWNAGHFALQKRFSGTPGLSMLLDYTWSKMFLANQFQEGMFSQQAKQLAIADETNVVVLSYDYALPFGKGRTFLSGSNQFVQHVVGGWDIAGIQTYNSGSPIIVTTEATNPAVQNVWAVRNPAVAIRTRTTCNDTVPGTGARYLNINAFSTPAPFTMGNTYTQSVRSCGYANENISITKITPITERINFKLGANFFNLFNRHTFTGMGLDINNPATFGTFSGASDPRLIQFNARLEF